MKTEILTTAKDAVELDVSDALGEWARINNSVTNLKLYMADALASKYDKSRVRRFAPANYKLYTGFTLEKALTRTRKMLQFCFDAKTPDIFDVFLVPLANDMVDCHKASNRFENTANDLLEKHDNKSLVDQRDDALQGAAEYLSLLGMMASIDEEFEWRWRPQRNDLFGKVKWYVDGVGDPVYGNSNIPVKVYAALAMNRIARGANDPVFQQFNALISGLMSEDGGFAEGTDYLDWALQEALPVYSWGIANGWIKPEDVPAKVRTSAEWLLRSADPSGFIPRVDDAASVSPLSGLTFWVAPFSLMNRDQRFLDYTKELFTRFPGSMVSQDGSAVRKFLTYPVSRQGPEVWSVPDGVHVQGGIGKIAFQSGTAGIGIGLLAEDGFLKDRGGSHDQQDNSSFTLSRWDKTTNTVDHLVVDPGYPGYNLRADGNEARYFYHNTPFVYSGSSIGGVSSNGMLSTDALWERSNVVFPYLDDYMCATSLWNTIFTAAGGANGWILGQVIQGVVTLDPYNTWANILMLPFVSVPFACGQFDLPNVGGIEGRAGGGAASFQYKYSNGLMSLQSYDAAGGNSSRAVFHEGDDVYVMDFFYREGVSADRKYGVSYNLPGDLQTEQSADNIWNAITLSSAARLFLFPGKASSSMDLENGAREYKTKDPVSFPVYRVSRAYQPGTSNAIFPHLSIFQTGPATATLDDYSTSAACLGAEICVERTSGTQRRVVFVRSGFPSQAGQVVVALGNGKSLVTDAGFGVLDIDQSTGNADVKHLYHVSSAELGGVALVAGGMMNEWPVPAVPRVADVKIGKGYGSFPNRILHVDENEVAQAEYEAVAGNNPSVRPGEELPVSDLNWFDAVVYANLRSQQDGLRSSYSWSSMTRGADGHVTALLDLTWDKEAPGYRLPTLEEWQALAGTAPTLAADGLWVEENAGGWLKGAGLGSSNVLGLRALWGNAAEWIWSDGESDAVVVGGNAADGIASLAPSRSLPKATTDALVGFRLVRSEEEVPALFGFDDPVRQWTIDGVAQSTGTDATGTRGSTLQFSGGYQKSVGPVFRTTEIATFGDKLLLDVFLPLVPVNPWWLGDVQVFISAPSQGIYSRSLGSVPLTGLTLGDWNTISVGIDASIQALLRLDVNDVHFEVVVNASQGDVVLLDNMRFGGNLIARTTPPLDQAQIAQEDQSLLGFENSSSWSAPVPISRNLAARTEGNASLQVAANGWVAVQSVPFASKALFSPTTANVSVDLFIPAPQPNPYWTGSVQLVLESVSAGIYAQSLGTVDLSAMAQGQFHHLTFAVPVGVQSKLAVGVPDLKLTLNLNTSSQAGPFLFDNIRGEP